MHEIQVEEDELGPLAGLAESCDTSGDGYDELDEASARAGLHPTGSDRSLGDRVAEVLGDPVALGFDSGKVGSLVRWIQRVERRAERYDGLIKVQEEAVIVPLRAERDRNRRLATQLRGILTGYARAAGGKIVAPEDEMSYHLVSTRESKKVRVLGHCSNPEHQSGNGLHFETDDCDRFMPEMSMIPAEFKVVKESPDKKKIGKALGSLDAVDMPGWAKHEVTVGVQIRL